MVLIGHATNEPGYKPGSFVYLKNPIHFMLDKRSLLAFQQHTGL